jgi:hypothetical protein
LAVEQREQDVGACRIAQQRGDGGEMGGFAHTSDITVNAEVRT